MQLISLFNIVLLLTIIITTTKAIKFNTESPVYVNFIPFKTGFNCQGKVDGLGYSMAIDTCVSFDGYLTSWRFSWNQNTGSIMGVKYNGVCKSSNRNATSPYRYLNMGCDKGGDIIFNPTRLPIETYDYKVQISTSPIYPTNSLYLVTQRLDTCSGTVIAYEFLTNETVAIAPGKIAYTYYCMPNGLPKMIDDSTGIVIKGDSCNMFRPFINGSSESSYSGTSGENLIIKDNRYGKGIKKKSGGGGGGGFGSAPIINYNDLISLGSGSGDTGSGVSTAEPTTANPTSASSTADSSTGQYSTGDYTETGNPTDGTSGNESTDTSGAYTTQSSTSGADDTGGTSNESTGVTSTSGNDSGSSTTHTSGSSESHVIYLTNTCSSA
ncbi:hypothetical protein ACTFIU_007449 [Dictyostelium citrinum]